MPYAVDSYLNAVIKCPRKITEAPGADWKISLLLLLLFLGNL